MELEGLKHDSKALEGWVLKNSNAEPLAESPVNRNAIREATMLHLLQSSHLRRTLLWRRHLRLNLKPSSLGDPNLLLMGDMWADNDSRHNKSSM